MSVMMEIILMEMDEMKTEQLNIQDRPSGSDLVEISRLQIFAMNGVVTVIGSKIHGYIILEEISLNCKKLLEMMETLEVVRDVMVSEELKMGLTEMVETPLILMFEMKIEAIGGLFIIINVMTGNTSSNDGCDST